MNATGQPPKATLVRKKRRRTKRASMVALAGAGEVFRPRRLWVPAARPAGRIPLPDAHDSLPEVMDPEESRHESEQGRAVRNPHISEPFPSPRRMALPSFRAGLLAHRHPSLRLPVYGHSGNRRVVRPTAAGAAPELPRSVAHRLPVQTRSAEQTRYPRAA